MHISLQHIDVVLYWYIFILSSLIFLLAAGHLLFRHFFVFPSFQAKEKREGENGLLRKNGLKPKKPPKRLIK